MGSMRKRNHQWNAQVRIKGWQQLSRTFKTKQQAKEWIQETELAIRSKATGVSERPNLTLSEACDIYGRTISTNHKGQAVENHRLAKFASSPIGCLELKKIQRHQIQSYFEMRSNTVSASTIRREFLLLKRLLTVAIERWNVPITAHPMRHMTTPPNASNRTRRITEQEWQQISKAASQQRNPLVLAVIQFAYETGMRRSEVLRLKPEDIDVELQIAHLDDTKNGTARSVPLSAKANQIVTQQLQEDHQEFVFNISATAIQQAWRRIINKTNISDLRFHDLRHEAISRFFEMGMSIAEVRCISGHKDVRQLFNYTHIQADRIVSLYFSSNETKSMCP
ncbi:site-specific integrase [Litoricolaceae bacterium]|nr:site-specific integrase [Litorivicinaceae bacterium]